MIVTYKKNKAFTLVELLVVISIIAILSTLVMINLTGAQKKSRNTKRTADLKELNTALRSYYEIKNSLPANVAGNVFCKIGFDYAGGKCLGELVANGYVSALPKGPEEKCILAGSPSSDSKCYSYHNYGSTTGAVVIGYQEPQEYGPYNKGYCCSSEYNPPEDPCDGGIKSYCMGFDY